MKDISAHVMDIVQNSIAADASEIVVFIFADHNRDEFTVRIEDNGKGMSEEMVAKVTSPFTTTRTTRKVGLGIPLIKEGVENTGGYFDIKSKVGVGTVLTAVYKMSHIDRPPLGDLAGVAATLVICNETIDFKISVKCDEQEFFMDTSEIKKTLDGVPLSDPDVSKFIMDYLKDGVNEVFGGNFE